MRRCDVGVLYLAWMDFLEAFKAARAVCELLYYFVRQCIGKSLLNTILMSWPSGL